MRAMRLWRSHPVLFATLLGGLFGLSYAIILESRASSDGSRGGVLALLWPGAPYGVGVSQSGVVEVAALLLIEVGANVLVWALLFAAPVGVVVVIRRLFGMGRKRE